MKYVARRSAGNLELFRLDFLPDCYIAILVMPDFRKLLRSQHSSREFDCWAVVTGLVVGLFLKDYDEVEERLTDCTVH